MASIFDRLLGRKTDATPASVSFDSVYEQATKATAARDFERAVRLYDQAITLDASHAEAYYKRGNALKNLGQLSAAIASYTQAIERRPDYAYAYCNRGVVQQALGLQTDALASYDQAIVLDPSDALAHYNRALVLQDCSRWGEVLESYNQAISINPEYADAQYNRSLGMLYLGDFERGWRGYEWRWKIAARLGIGEFRNFTQPLWLGEEPIADRRLLLHSEAGLGDTLQFCRYATLIAARGATVFLEVPPPLVDLLGNLEGVSRVIAKGSALPAFDYHCPLMSLPLACKTTLQTVPSVANYLRADNDRVVRWLTQLPEPRRPRVGLTWSGNPNNPIDQRRSIRLADWAAQLPPEFDYFCLQKDVREEDRAVLDSSPLISSIADDELDFVSTAALCECMDVVVSVDTSLAHLSGALGRPTWILLPFTPDWRWLQDRDDSPWYPSAKLYRQKAAGEWNEVFARVAADLREKFQAG
ncbi:MAG: tetratricopeptide repeat-containing glycosyltransferase family protein [Gammaproteobacteria bacterium]